MIKARSIRVCLHNKIKTVRNINGNSGRNCVRLMSNLANKRFTIVSPDETIALVPTGQILNTVVASSGINHDYLLGFKCDKSNHGAEFSLEHSLQSAVVAYNVSRDVSALDIDGLNVAPVYLCENESRISSNRGVAISSASVKDMESISIKEIFHKYGINTMFRVTQSRSEVNGGESQDRIKVHQLDDSYHGNKGEDFTRDITQPPVSPVMENDTFSPIFQDLSRARQVIEKCSNWMEEAKELMRIFDENVPATLNLQQLKQEMKFPFVVVEGLDATGKTTLTGKIEQKLSAERYYTPPPHVQALRKRFDDQPEVIRRAYYALGNYIVAVEILKTCQKKAVIMDRYWHSTTAYGIANETSNQDMPEEGHWVYQWPSDLLTPDLVLFLSVSEEIRQKRMMGRGGENTLEEKHLKKDRLFRERLYLAYKRMRNPGCIELDASGSVESVMEAAEAQLDKLKSKM